MARSRREPTLKSGAYASASAWLTGKLGPTQQSELILGAVLLIALLASLAANAVTVSTLSTDIGIGCGVALLALVVNHVARSWLSPQPPAPQVVDVHPDSVRYEGYGATPVEALLQLQRSLQGRGTLPEPDGAVINAADITDAKSIREYNPEEKARVVRELNHQMLKSDLDATQRALATFSEGAESEALPLCAQRDDKSEQPPEANPKPAD